MLGNDKIDKIFNFLKSQTSAFVHGCDVWLNDQACVTRTTLVPEIGHPQKSRRDGLVWF